MKKTLEELLSGGTLAEIIARQTENTKAAALIFDKTDATADEVKSAVVLDDETEKLQVKRVELEGIEAAKARNTKRMSAMNEPVRPQHHGGNGGDTDKDVKRAPAYSSVGSLKHINVGTRQENEEMAYRFFKWATATMQGDAPLKIAGMKWCEENGLPLKADMNEGTNEAGGYLVPVEFDPMLIRLVETYGKFRQYTRITPMSSDTKNQPRRTGGITTYWTGEAQLITRSRPTYDNISLVAKKLAALVAISSELSEDSAINTADEIAFEIGYGFALAEDNAGFLGDGTSTFGGIVGIAPKLLGLSGTIANIAGLVVASGNLFSEFVLGDFNAVVGRLPQYADTPNAGWFCHRSFYYNVMQKLELAAGGVTANEIASIGSGNRARPLFLGYPVNFIQVMPRADANSQVACIFGDLAMGTVMGDRRRRTMFTDPYSLAAYDQIQIRGTERIDINVFDVGNASATASERVAGSVVGLISAAS